MGNSIGNVSRLATLSEAFRRFSSVTCPISLSMAFLITLLVTLNGNVSGNVISNLSGIIIRRVFGNVITDYFGKRFH